MRRDEDGFTLVELLMAIAVLGIIVSAIATALIVTLRNLDATHDRMAESHDAQMASAFLVTDVQSATTITTTQPACPTTTATVADFVWDDQGTANRATYVLETVGGEQRLRRSQTVGTTTSEVVVAHHLTTECSPGPVVVSMPNSNRVLFTLTDASGYRFSLTGEKRVR